jgi:serine/threonine protein kinase
LRELAVLKVATHENLVQYIGAFNHENFDGNGLSACYIVTELCGGGDLLRLLLNTELEINWTMRIKIAAQVASAMNFLHQKNLIHRDIKSSVRISIDTFHLCEMFYYSVCPLLSRISY